MNTPKKRSRNEINALMVQMYTNNHGLGYIFRQMRELHEHEGLSDFILYTRIIIRLRDHGCTIPVRQIVDHFSKCVDPDDYAQEEKQELLNFLKTVDLKTTH